MKRYKKMFVSMVLIVISLLLSQCVLPERNLDDYIAHIMYPLQGTVLGVGETARIYGEVLDLQEPFDAPRESHVMFLANGVKIGEADVTITYLNNVASESIDWIPDSPGEYYLQIFSSRPGRWAMSEAVKVCVIDLSSGYEGECEIPEPSPGDYGVSIIVPSQGETFILDEIDPVRGIRTLGRIWDEREPFDTPRNNLVMWLINGRKFGPLESLDLTSSTSFAYVQMLDPWIPEEPGEYFLQVFSSQPDTGSWAISESVKVCVIDFSSESPDGYEGECEIPERSPDAVPGSLTFSVTASPDPLHYWPGWWDPGEAEYIYEWRDPLPDGCSLNDPFISFRATASDPNDDIVFVKVDLSRDLLTPSHSEYSRSDTLILTRESGSSRDPKIFSGETYLFQAGYFPIEINQTFEVTWTAHALDRSGDVIASDGPYTTPIEPCYEAEMVPLSAPLPSEEPDLIPLNTMSCEGIRGVSIRENGLMRTNVKVPGASGDNNATLNDLPITCKFYEAYPDTLLCDSLKPPGNTYATLIIFDDLGQEFCKQTFSVPGQSTGETDKDKSGGCNLSSEICSQSGYSFDENKCECVPIS